MWRKMELWPWLNKWICPYCGTTNYSKQVQSSLAGSIEILFCTVALFLSRPLRFASFNISVSLLSYLSSPFAFTCTWERFRDKMYTDIIAVNWTILTFLAAECHSEHDYWHTALVNCAVTVRHVSGVFENFCWSNQLEEWRRREARD
jgi:hypothetical protein